MRLIPFTVAALLLAVSAGAEELQVDSFRLSGPHRVAGPMVLDSLNVKSKPFEIKNLLDMATASGKESSEPVSAGVMPGGGAEGYTVAVARFAFDNSRFAKVEVKVETDAEAHSVWIDGKMTGSQALAPGTHQVQVRYLTAPGKSTSLSVSLQTAKDGILSLRTDGRHLYSLRDVLLGTRISGVQISPKGNYLITSYTRTYEGGRTESFSELSEAASGRVLRSFSRRVSWMPVSNRYWFTRKEPSGTVLVSTDPASGEESILAEGVPEVPFTIAPTEDFLLCYMGEDGPKEKEDIYRILSPDDRQSGWRHRSYPARYDLATGVLQRLTWGYHNARISDISPDGGKALLMVSEERLEQRPTTLSTLYMLDLQTLEAKVLVERDGFMRGAYFSPDGGKLLLSGSPEAFGGVGKNVGKGQIPNSYDNQLYLMDPGSGRIKPLTRDFDPNVQTARWSAADGNIYFTAENKDCYSLYRLNPASGKITLLQSSEELVKGFSIPREGKNLAYFGQGASNSDRSWLLDLGSGKSQLLKDINAVVMKDVDLGECSGWNFRNSKGETVCGRFYLPPHFDASRKYPLIVNYYGGCSPTSRTLESRYPHHAYAALGYVVYVVAVPSGATGNGQKWSARHVNTAGDGPAQDIIEGTQRFCKEHPYVDASRIGCIGASYGGFMSEYLPTQTDIFACSVSHAGISDHTSYWGFGYWGYSYSEVSMADSYPWSDRELYVDHSPLYLADKINTPLLLIHGDADTNVPFNESVQLFTALKLLGKETALVAVKDQNHHILDYSKRIGWQNTIWAWFAKWLQDDASWWDELYPPVNL